MLSMITVQEFMLLFRSKMRVDVITTSGIYSYRENELFNVTKDFGNRCIYCFKIEDDILKIEL